jgi:group II intron reverse transcriptase/maturase
MTFAQKYIGIVHDRGQRGLELRKVYRNIQDGELFLVAYGKLYANKGATTPGVDSHDTVDGMSLERIDKIIEALKNGTYQWQPVRRTEIPKKRNKKAKRPIGSPTWSDKLLQEVIRMVLEAYYEPQFSAHSHGFRPGRGCHTALREIYATWKGTKWFIEADIKGFYDNIDFDLLLEIISRNIKDERFLKLIKAMLQAGYMQDWKYHQTYSGVPQGGVVSPILSNILLNELDQFVEKELIPYYNRGEKRRYNPHYEQLHRAMVRARRQGKIDLSQQLKRERQSLPSIDPQDPDYRRLRYCRYGDDFVLGWAGSHQEALEIKHKIQDFLASLKLTLSAEKTLITHATSERARFLNYDIYVGRDNTKVTGHKQQAQHITRSINGKIILSVPKEVAQEWRNRFTQKGKPVHRPYLMKCSDYEIVQTYGLEFQGLVNYYSMAHNVSTRLYPVKYTHQQSLAKTLAAKHNQKVSWVYRKYKRKSDQGITAMMVEVPNPKHPDKPLIAKFGDKPICFNPNITIKDRMAQVYHGRNELVRRLLANECELCGSSEKINVHHVRKLKDVRKKYQGRPEPPRWVRFMMERNRKTVVVCHQCHVEIHAGKYDGRKVE